MRAEMACFEALGLGDAWNVGIGCFCAVAGLAEDLKVMGLVCAAECEGQNVIDVPDLCWGQIGSDPNAFLEFS